MLRSKAFYILSVVLLFLSVPLFSEVCFTDGEYQELTVIFDELETINNQLSTQVTTLQTDLTISKVAQTRLNTELTGAQTSLDAVRNSLAVERKANRVKVLASAGFGVVLGFIFGLLFGT